VVVTEGTEIETGIVGIEMVDETGMGGIRDAVGVEVGAEVGVGVGAR